MPAESCFQLLKRIVLIESEPGLFMQATVRDETAVLVTGIENHAVRL